MSWREAIFWLEAMAYDAELAAEALQGEGDKEVHSLDELVQVLPKAENKINEVKHQG